MAYMVAQGGVIAIYQGAAETGPRALGHRSILANPCDPQVRERLNERVKYREAIRPLAPMATLEAAQQYFALLPGASDADYNAYNYMGLTADSKPGARTLERARQIPRGHSPAGADGDAGSRQTIFRAAARRVGRRLQRL